MPYNYLPIKRQAALRLAQLVGTSQETLEAAYAGAWATALDGCEIPASAFKDLILMIEKELATVIGNNPNHPARSMLYARSVDLQSLDNTPTTSNTGAEWVGVFDSVCDSATGKPLTLQPPQTIEDLSDPFFNDIKLYNYSEFGNQVQVVENSIPNFYYQGCAWDYDTQSDAYDNDGSSPLPQACANMHVNGVCANSLQVGWVDNAGLIQQDLALYEKGMSLLTTGLPNVPLASQSKGTAG